MKKKEVLNMNMKWHISFKGTIQMFPGPSGWYYVAVPKKYTSDLKNQRGTWGMYPIIAQVGNTSWKTKLMTKKGGDFFIALKSDIRKKEELSAGDIISISFQLELKTE
jgi:hypothetical protein